jgi:hypothetical protein
MRAGALPRELAPNGDKEQGEQRRCEDRLDSREHKHGLATQTVGPWLGDPLKGLGLGVVLGGLLMMRFTLSFAGCHVSGGSGGR